MKTMKTMKTMKKQLGMTLLEMLVTVAIFGIIAGAAGPSFMSTIERSQIRALNDSVLTFMKLARSEAIARSKTISVCPSNNQSTCSGVWSDGWIVFIDDNADRTMDFPEDELLKVSDQLSAEYLIELVSVVPTIFQFNSQGRALERGTFIVCGPNAEDEGALGIIVNLSGGTRYATDSNSDNIRENHLGDNVSC